MREGKEARWEQRVADACRRLESLASEPDGNGGEGEEARAERRLFALLTQVYVKEEGVRVQQKLKRKSSQRISRVLHETMGQFLAQRLTAYEFTPSEGLLFATQAGKVAAAIKCIPDLGSYDTHSWNATIARFAKQYQKRHALAAEQLLFVVCSLSKSLDAAHARALTGIEVCSGTALAAPAYREALQAYVGKCVEMVEALPAPSRQIYFLSADVHPNVLAQQLIEGEKAELPDRWLRPSIRELLHYLDSGL